MGEIGGASGPANIAYFTKCLSHANKDFLALARRCEHKVIIDPLAKKQDKMQGRHANTQIPEIIGSARL